MIVSNDRVDGHSCIRQLLQLFAEIVNQVYAEMVCNGRHCHRSRGKNLRYRSLSKLMSLRRAVTLAYLMAESESIAMEKSGYAVGKIDARVGIDECHLGFFVVILVVHVVYVDVHCFVVNAGNLRQHFLCSWPLLLQSSACRGSVRGYPLPLRFRYILATSAVDGEQQCFGEAGTCAEELDLLTDGLVRYATGNTVVVAVTYFAHQIIVSYWIELVSTDTLAQNSLETFPAIRGLHRTVILGSGDGPRLYSVCRKRERSLCYFHATVIEASADSFGNPSRVSGEDVVVRLQTQVAYHTQFDDELVNQFLSKSFVNLTVSQIVFDENVEE